MSIVKIINRFVENVIGSGSNVSQICIGNGNIQARGSIINGKVVVNGKEIDLGSNEEWIDKTILNGDIFIEVTGDVGKIDIPTGKITVKGSVTGDINLSQGDVEIEGDVDGDVKTSMGNIRIKGNHKNGKVHTSMGSVNIGSVKGE